MDVGDAYPLVDFAYNTPIFANIVNINRPKLQSFNIKSIWIHNAKVIMQPDIKITGFEVKKDMMSSSRVFEVFIFAILHG